MKTELGSAIFSKLLLFFFLSYSNLPAAADIADLHFQSETQRQQFRNLSGQLRCLVCQNQSLADSNAELAKDLRAVLYQQVIRGHSDKQIITFMADRYGDFILYKPKLSRKTLILWIAPFLLLLAGIITLKCFNRGSPLPEEKLLPKEVLEKVRRLLDGESNRL